MWQTQRCIFGTVVKCVTVDFSHDQLNALLSFLYGLLQCSIVSMIGISSDALEMWKASQTLSIVFIQIDHKSQVKLKVQVQTGLGCFLCYVRCRWESGALSWCGPNLFTYKRDAFLFLCVTSQHSEDQRGFLWMLFCEWWRLWMLVGRQGSPRTEIYFQI